VAGVGLRRKAGEGFGWPGDLRIAVWVAWATDGRLVSPLAQRGYWSKKEMPPVREARAAERHDTETQGPKLQVSTCGYRSGVVVAKGVGGQADVPVPPVLNAPAQIADPEAAVGDAVDGSPEKHVLAFPLDGNDVRVGEQVIEHISVEDGLAF
jgi:hypothetical protein